MKNVINGGVTEVIDFEGMPRGVIIGNRDYSDVAWCPCCGAAFRKDDKDNWGRKECFYCGQALKWPEEK